MDIQDIHGVSRIGAKLRQEIRRQTQGYPSGGTITGKSRLADFG